MSPTQYWHGAKGWSDEEKLFYIGCKGTVQIYNQSIMPQPAEIYIASLAALHAATPTLPAKVRVFQTLDQVGRVPMYDALRTDRKIMTLEFTKAFDEKRILPKAPYTDNSMSYVDAVLRGKIVEINTCRKGTRNLSETFSKKYKGGLVLTPIRGISLVPVLGAAMAGSANAVKTRIVRRTKPSMDDSAFREFVEARQQSHANVMEELMIGVGNDNDGDRLHSVNVFYKLEVRESAAQWTHRDRGVSPQRPTLPDLGDEGDLPLLYHERSV